MPAPIAGLGSVSAGDGLTEQFLYDDNLADGDGLDSGTGAALLIGTGSVSLASAIAKLADTCSRPNYGHSSYRIMTVWIFGFFEGLVAELL